MTYSTATHRRNGRGITKDDIESQLTPEDRWSIFRQLGFEFRGRTPNVDGWVSGILGPKVLGEGKNPDFSVNLHTGAVRDHGSSGYTGDLYQVVGDVLGLTFPEVLRYTQDTLGLSTDREDKDGGRPADNGADVVEKSEIGVSSEECQAWSDRLQGDTDVARAARHYLVETRGLSEDTLIESEVGLARSDEFRSVPGADWWITIPVTETTLDLDGEVLAVKGLGFNPGKSDWARDRAGKKIFRNVGSGLKVDEMLDPGQEDPLLLCEGETDFLSARTAGYSAATGTTGANGFKREWANRLAQSRSAREFGVVICFDGDEAGRKAGQEVAQLLFGAGITVRTAILPEGSDLNDILCSERRPGVDRIVREAVVYTPTGGREESGLDTDAEKSVRTLPGTKKASGGTSKTQAQELVELASDVDLFHDPHDVAYGVWCDEKRQHIAQLSSSDFRDLLQYRFYQSNDRPPSSQALQDACGQLKAEARFEGPKRKTYLRVAQTKGCIYLDLCNAEGEVVEIRENGWEVIPAREAPVLFLRTPAMEGLPCPVRGGSLRLLSNHLNIREGDFPLLAGYLVQAISPAGPYPILNWQGEQGTGKTTASEIVRSVIDPSSVPTRSAPRSGRNLVVAARNVWVLVFDNLSGLPKWLSDCFCRLSTGGGFGVRQLYTDRGEDLFFGMRPLILNGIDEVATRGDLVDRCLIIRLDPIDPTNRRTQAEVMAEFRADHPEILGALLDAASMALRRRDEVVLKQLPRMADFAKWVVAAEPALSVPEGSFLKAYMDQQMESSENAVENDTVAAAVFSLVRSSDEEEWKGTMSELLRDAQDHLPNPEKPPRDYPKTYQSMTDQLARVMPALRAVGITREDLPRTSTRRGFRLKMRNAETDSSGEGVSHASSVSLVGAEASSGPKLGDEGVTHSTASAEGRVIDDSASAPANGVSDDDDTDDTPPPSQSPSADAEKGGWPSKPESPF